MQSDHLIYARIPSGFAIREKNHPYVKRLRLSELRCLKYIDVLKTEKSLGTLGGGNHFIEVDKAERNRGDSDMRIDMGILEWIQSSLRCDLLDIAMPFITRLGDGGIVWIICALLLLVFPKTRKCGAAMAVSMALEVICCNMLLKPFVARLRPCDVNSAVELLIPHPKGYSFPSGHTSASFAAASALFFSKSRLGIPAFILAVLIGFSRLYLYVHYPSDVLAGAFLGIMLGWLGNTLVKVIGEKQGWH